MLINKALTLIIIACVAIGTLWYFNRRRITSTAASIVGEIHAVWAAQGPFENGELSAKAMHYATLAVRGNDSLRDNEWKESISLHEKAYNSDPERWEELRQKSLLRSKGEKCEKQLAKAKQIASNDNALSSFGSKLYNDGSKESNDLIAFLNEIYKSRHGRYIESDLELGFIYAQVYSESFGFPNERIYRLFLQLRDRCEKAKSENE